jgi:two-component system OmpR family response regulator/two-component system response regulator QseB
MRILLIEDDPSLGSSLQAWLQMDGYAVDWLQRGDQAAAALATHDYQCVLLDRSLPGLDGDAVLQALRAAGAPRSQLPVIVITARDTLADRIQGLDLGADDYLVKPFDLEERPTHILSRAQLEEALYGWGEEVESNTIEVHVSNLRKKLGSRFIVTVRNQGYGLAPA